MNRTYFTLNDLVQEANGASNFIQGFSCKDFIEIMCFETLSTSAKAKIAAVCDTYVEKLWSDYIWNKFRYADVCYIDDYNGIDRDIYKACKIFINTFFGWIVRSKDNYELLIDALEDNKSKLLEDVKTITSTKFNDTPQNAQGTYDWSDDDHMTNITTSESSNNVAPLIDRIKDIENNISDYYDQWCNEFYQFVIFNDMEDLDYES